MPGLRRGICRDQRVLSHAVRQGRCAYLHRNLRELKARGSHLRWCRFFQLVLLLFASNLTPKHDARWELSGDQRVIFRVWTYPEPIDAVGFLKSQCAIAIAYANYQSGRFVPSRLKCRDGCFGSFLTVCSFYQRAFEYPREADGTASRSVAA
jgi:hypothetical protein